MDTKLLEAFAKEAAKSIKSESVLNTFRQMLPKVAIETALNAETEENPGYEKHSLLGWRFRGVDSTLGR